MNAALTPGIKELIETVHYRPAVSIIMPFDPKMSGKNILVHSLKIVLDKVAQELQENYPEEIAALIMHKLNAIIKVLNYSTHKKGIAIYVSPVFEKILYLDIAVEEKIIIDESFEIRDLVYSKKQQHKYLVLLLNGKEARMFIGNSTTFIKLVTNTPETVYAYINDTSQKVGNFSDAHHLKEIVMDKFLHHIDNSLDFILNAYHLPLFVIGTKKIVGHFKTLTKHAAAVVEYIHGSYDRVNEDELRKIIEPHVADWKKVTQIDLLNQIEEAAGEKKLAIGIREVWNEAMAHKGKFLIVEKNYMFAAEHSSSEYIIYKAIKPYNKFSYIKDAVDDVIEKVLENGGDVEFVDEGLLNKYLHIALIKYY